MRKYEYVRLKTGAFLGAESNEHRQIIDDYAAKGYRLAGCIPVTITNNGVIFAMDLVFEQDWEAEEE